VIFSIFPLSIFLFC